MIKAIAFDLFDTLVDQNHERLRPVEIEGRRMGATTPALHDCIAGQAGDSISILDFADLLRAVDRELRVETIDSGIELASLDRFSALAARLSCRDILTAAKSMTEVHMGMLHEAVTVPVHHEPVLAALALDYPLAICSNFSHAATARSILEEARFGEHLSTVVISEEIGIRKPRPEIFEEVARSVGFAPNEILHVGDQLAADVGGAAAAGMRTVWLTRCVRDPEAELAKFDGPRPDFAIEDLIDLPVLVARLNAS